MLGKGHIRATKEKSFLDGYLLLSLLNGRARWSSWTSSFHSPSSRLHGAVVHSTGEQRATHQALLCGANRCEDLEPN